MTCRSHRLLTACLVQNNYNSPSMPQPYDMVSSLQPSAVQSPSSFAFCFRIVHQLIFARAILLLYAVVHSMSHLVSRQQHTGKHPTLLANLRCRNTRFWSTKGGGLHTTQLALLAVIQPLHFCCFHLLPGLLFNYRQCCLSVWYNCIWCLHRNVTFFSNFCVSNI